MLTFVPVQPTLLHLLSLLLLWRGCHWSGGTSAACQFCCHPYNVVLPSDIALPVLLPDELRPRSRHERDMAQSFWISSHW